MDREGSVAARVLGVVSFPPPRMIAEEQGQVLFCPYILVHRRTSGEKVACHGSLQRPH
jgi:hypothetical protein